MAFYIFDNRLAVNRDHIESASASPVITSSGSADLEFDIQMRTRSGYSVRIVVTGSEWNKFLEWLRA